MRHPENQEPGPESTVRTDRRTFVKNQTLAIGAMVASATVPSMVASAPSAPPRDPGRGPCAKLPPPPSGTAISLEGQNCVACTESRKLFAEHRDVNANREVQRYEDMCRLFETELDYPPIVYPSRLTYVPNPPLPVPPCQKVAVPPVVPVADRISLTNRHVVVVGGSRGNGKAVAARMAAEGAVVLATSRHPECYAPPVGHELVELDVRLEESVKRFMARAAERLEGRIDVLVNCPKTLWLGPLSEATGDDLLNNLEIDLVGYHRVTHHALPYMRHSDETRVISIGSLAAYVQVAYTSGGYSIAKRGLQNWNDTMQVEELLKKAQGRVQSGPSFSLLEPFDTQSILGVWEYQKPRALSSGDPLVLGARFLNAQDVLNGISTEHIAELVFRVAVAPQPGVRYALVHDDQTLPDGTPLLAALQALNAASADDAINYFIQPFNAARNDPGNVAAARVRAVQAFCGSGP